MVALGDTFGIFGGSLCIFYRNGRQPLGVAFQLVDPDVPANRVMPRTGTSGIQDPGVFRDRQVTAKAPSGDT